MRDLRREVARRADEQARAGQVGGAVQVRDTEVGEDGPVVARDEHVAGLDVAVHNAVSVRLGQPGGRLLTDARGTFDRDRSPIPDDVAEGRAVDEFHDDPRATVLLGHVEHRDDGGVAELGGATRLAEHAGAQDLHLVRGEVGRGGQLLDRDRAVEQDVRPTPDASHSALADDLVQTVAVDQDTAGVGFRTVHVSQSSGGPVRDGQERDRGRGQRCGGQEECRSRRACSCASRKVRTVSPRGDRSDEITLEVRRPRRDPRGSIPTGEASSGVFPQARALVGGQRLSSTGRVTTPAPMMDGDAVSSASSTARSSSGNRSNRRGRTSLTSMRARVAPRQ